jgi:hypothetical protein
MSAAHTLIDMEIQNNAAQKKPEINFNMLPPCGFFLGLEN